MILIISSDNDITTNDVIDWLYYFKADYCRINGTSQITIDNITIDNNFVDFNLNLKSSNSHTIIVKYSQIKSIWYRRGKINVWNEVFFSNRLSVKKNNAVKVYLKREQLQVEEFIHFMLNKKNHINSISDEPNTNKLKNLVVANECGLKTPLTYITSIKKSLLNFKQHYSKDLITKPIKFGNIEFVNSSVGAGTVIANLDSNDILDVFFPSLFQERIEKKWEIRVFATAGKLYSTAIFSQNNEKTAVDFRNYDDRKPNRVTPFILPNQIEKKIVSLMKKLNLNSASIDLIYTIDNQFIFLEVNPVGQFSQVSYPANYYLEKNIAKILINE